VADRSSGTDFQQAGWPIPQSTPPLQQGHAGSQQAWPQGNVGISVGPPVSNPLLQQDRSNVYDPAVTVATVGNLYILRGDLIGEANIMLASSVEKIPADQLEKQRTEILETRDKLAKQLLNQAVERKLMYLAFLRGIPADRRAEAELNIKERIGAAFNSDLDKMAEEVRKTDEEGYADLVRDDVNLFRLALIMKQQNMVTPIQLDNYLRRYGSSLEKQQQAFAERALGRQALMGEINTRPEVTHIEMLDYYNKRIDLFRVPDRAKWEQLTVRFDRFNSREKCRAEINAMGNEIWLGGARFDAVAKRNSQGVEAEKGGFHDWTEWGDLEVSQEIQQAAFSFPPGELSPVIEDIEGLHIIRVIDRAAAHVTPFSEVQVAIKNKLRGQKRSVEITKFVTQLRRQTPIWTIYDDAGNNESSIADRPTRPNASFPR
jgi:parvulin-like peptidyl-prolyl isomerase